MKHLEAKKMWDDRFNSEGFLFGTEVNTFLQEMAPKYLKENAHILCIADGEGRNSTWLAQQNHRVDAFDFSDIAIEKAKKFASSKNVEVNYVVSDCESINWEAGDYDAIIAIFIQFTNPKERSRLFKDMLLALKPGGVLILQGYTPKQLEYKTGGPSQIENLYTERVIKSLLKNTKIEVLKIYEADLSEGKAHSGISALMGVVAIKKPVSMWQFILSAIMMPMFS
jgi:2-polyprenyl-3-methyl-5-hydroxy-6-metoxy-1,4-benzoquinol methylase